MGKSDMWIDRPIPMLFMLTHCEKISFTISMKQGYKTKTTFFDTKTDSAFFHFECDMQLVILPFLCHLFNACSKQSTVIIDQ